MGQENNGLVNYFDYFRGIQSYSLPVTMSLVFRHCSNEHLPLML